MSAFITSHEHTLVLAHAISLHVAPENMTVQKIYDALVRENIKSVNYRYHEKTRVPKTCLTMEEVWHSPRILSSVEIFKLSVSQEYQSCEHPTWRKSKAFRYIVELQAFLACKILRETQDYDKAEWTI